jgi:DNA-binding MarR family transcriptional regulator
MLPTKVQILKEKIRKVIESEEESRKDFLAIVACHNGSIMPDSISISFKMFKEKYGDEKFNEVKDYLIEEGIISIPTSHYKPIEFSVRNEKGEYDSSSGEELSKYFGKMIFEQKQKIKEMIEEILRNEEGREFLKYIAIQKGIHICDGAEPEIKETIGKRSYEIILSKLLEVGVLNEYAWSSRKHAYKGYKLLPFIDDYIKSKLGIFELEDAEKTVLAYIEFMSKIFSFPTRWYVWFNYPTESEYKILTARELAQKFLAHIIYRNMEDVKKIIEKLQDKGLIQRVDLGYSRAGYHGGIILQLSQSAQEIAKQEENKLIEKVKSRLQEIFSEKDNKIIYYLFSKEKFPLKLLSLIKQSSVDALISTGIIGDDGEFLQFSGEVYDIYAGIEPGEISKWLKEKCESLLSREEKLFIGFLSGCKNVILDKRQNWESWSSVSPRTQRNYQSAYDTLVINFPYLKRLFSKLTGMPIEKVDEIALSLEERGFLIKERDDRCGFPGYALIYRIPVKFNFEFDLSIVRSKIREYIQFLAKNIHENYNQLIFLEYLIRIYEKYQCNFLVNSSLIKEQLLQILSYTPPAEYSPIYAFEGETIILHPLIKDEVKNEVYELKTKLIEPLKNILQELTKDYRSNIAYNYSEKIQREGYFMIEVESPDPSIGVVSFIITPWIMPLDIQEISSLCTKSSTVNLFTFYPNYPSLKSMITINGRYNLIIIRNAEAHLFLKRADKLTQIILGKLSKYFKLLKQEEIKPEIEDLQKKYPNLSKIRFIIPEAEDLLRDAVRPYLIREFGDTWQEKIKQYFPKAEERKQRWEKEHGEKTDILQGLSIGDFLTLFENKSFSFIKDCFKDFSLVKASLKIFLRKKVYHHGKPKDEKDISDDEVNLINTAFMILKEMMKR